MKMKVAIQLAASRPSQILMGEPNMTAVVLLISVLGIMWIDILFNLVVLIILQIGNVYLTYQNPFYLNQFLAKKKIKSAKVYHFEGNYYVP